MVNREWDIRREGRTWKGDEAFTRSRLAPGKVEMIEGKLFCTDEQRLTVMALLLENLGVDQVVRLGDPAVWRAAVAELGGQLGTRS
jgi:hypothetical protein